MNDYEREGWGWWTVFNKIDEFEKELSRLVPNPDHILNTNKEYTPNELRDLLQRFGSYLSTLHNLEGKMEAQSHAVKEGYKAGMSVAVAKSESKATSVSGKENEVLANNEIFKDAKRMQIDYECQLLLLKGWRQAYEQGWATVSRLITITIGEANLQTSRYN